MAKCKALTGWAVKGLTKPDRRAKNEMNEWTMCSSNCSARTWLFRRCWRLNSVRTSCWNSRCNITSRWRHCRRIRHRCRPPVHQQQWQSASCRPCRSVQRLSRSAILDLLRSSSRPPTVRHFPRPQPARCRTRTSAVRRSRRRPGSWVRSVPRRGRGHRHATDTQWLPQLRQSTLTTWSTPLVRWVALVLA